MKKKFDEAIARGKANRWGTSGREGSVECVLRGVGHDILVPCGAVSGQG